MRFRVRKTMYFVLFVTAALLNFVVSTDSRNDLKSQEERDLMRLFLQKIPDASKNVGRRREVPSFLKKLFKMQSRRSTFSQVFCTFSEDRLLSNKRTSLFSFDLSYIENFREANQIQLRVFKRRSKRRDSREFYYIHLYQIFDNAIHNASRESKHLISSRFVRNSRGEWLVFDVISELNSQDIVLTTTKPSFLLQIKAVNDQAKSKPVSIAKFGRKQPFMLVIFQKKVSPTSEMKTPSSSNLYQFGKLRITRSSSSNGRPTGLCSRRKSLHINFQSFGMSNIIAPKSYEAYYCDGKCPILSGSIYSFLRNRYRLQSKKKIPAACCVPTELESLQLLYINTKGNIILDHFREMVVSSCGCR
ncbi:bone morphogenetic protein 7-like [Dendronephthya gigantea]|uniref:bone morphogenetic protein 7-like n=1 Tax=Dendronephthya gigantea TaxID=151771 RepID=UPI00106BE187|nr:bone morphogenetic protein 7-like [Dendronephthya gigantea]